MKTLKERLILISENHSSLDRKKNMMVSWITCHKTGSFLVTFRYICLKKCINTAEKLYVRGLVTRSKTLRYDYIEKLQYASVAFVLYMSSRQPYWGLKTVNGDLCWCPKPGNPFGVELFSRVQLFPYFFR